MDQIQFIQVTPEQLKNEIVEGIKTQLEDIKQNFQPKEPETYLTRNAVATMFDVDISTVHNWSKSGKLKKVCIGSRVYYRRSDIEASLIEV